ncbi:MAG: GAF domain-containing protein [Clostridia bacterium]|nr:GAF domain-containing protein [Clostridia bacterium]
MPDYKLLCAQLEALNEDNSYPIAILANASALLFDALDNVNWAGFYLLEGDKLVLGPFQGKVACVTIPVGKGVCGTAFANNETLVVPDVHQFCGHIACDSASNSEIVVPLRKNDGPFGVLDIDSTVFCRFDEEDRAGLEAFARVLEKAF